MTFREVIILMSHLNEMDLVMRLQIIYMLFVPMETYMKTCRNVFKCMNSEWNTRRNLNKLHDILLYYSSFFWFYCFLSSNPLCLLSQIYFKVMSKLLR